jgi:biopolymer transport protein ExbD
MRFKQGGGFEKVEPDMTPMIDCCFQLIIFFMLSLKIYSPEGDFGIRMPQMTMASGQQDFDQLPPMRVRLAAGANGEIKSITLGEVNLGKSFPRLREHIRALVGDQAGPSSNAEVEFDCDYDLAYRHVIEAITAVSGYVKDGQIHKLVEKIKFTPRK